MEHIDFKKGLIVATKKKDEHFASIIIYKFSIFCLKKQTPIYP